MSYDPILKVFKRDYETPNRSNWDLPYKNRLSMDVGYLYPVGLYDVLPNTYFKLDINAVLSSNPTIAPILGSMKFRAEAYFVEKAAYCQKLRDNEKLDVNRNIPFPCFSAKGNANVNDSEFRYVPATSLLEHLQMYPSGWKESDWALRSSTGGLYPDDFCFPKLNAIPFIMYHDIYRNYYVNVQDSNNIPVRVNGFVPHEDPTDQESPSSPIKDVYITREQLDSFVRQSRDSQSVDSVYSSTLRIDPFPTYRPHDKLNVQDMSEHTHFAHLHYGLLRRTYNNDFFTSFISNSNAELMKSHSTIDVSGGTLNVEQISLANRNWRFAVRSLLWGTDWSDYNRVHFGTKVVTRYGKPQFLGAISSDVIFNDVISQSQTGDNGAEGDANPIQANRNLGSRAGIAFGSVTNKTSNKKEYRPFVEFTTEEEGYVMVLLSLVPEVDYCQGVDPMFFKTNLKHSYSPEYNAYGLQDFHKSWASALPTLEMSHSLGRSFPMYNTAIHKVPIWYEYMAKYNQLHGLFTLDNQYRYWTNVRLFTNLIEYFYMVYDPSDPQSAEFWSFWDSTYVLPEMHNYQFANNIGTDNYQVQLKLDCFQKQLLDKQIIAYL